MKDLTMQPPAMAPTGPSGRHGRAVPVLAMGAMALLVALATIAAHSPALAQTAKDTVPAMAPSLSAPGAGAVPAAGAPRTIGWEQLMPKGWDPFKDIKAESLQILDDADPRAAQLLKRMREVWDSAPVNSAIVGQTVRLPGYLVPLEDRPEGVKEFLLVPYFGACVHSPPPPANQIVHVLLDKPVKGFRTMDTVWISGPLAADRVDSYMGVAGYRMKAQSVTRYSER